MKNKLRREAVEESVEYLLRFFRHSLEYKSYQILRSRRHTWILIVYVCNNNNRTSPARITDCGFHSRLMLIISKGQVCTVPRLGESPSASERETYVFCACALLSDIITVMTFYCYCVIAIAPFFSLPVSSSRLISIIIIFMRIMVIARGMKDAWNASNPPTMRRKLMQDCKKHGKARPDESFRLSWFYFSDSHFVTRVTLQMGGKDLQYIHAF